MEGCGADDSSGMVDGGRRDSAVRQWPVQGEPTKPGWILVETGCD